MMQGSENSSLLDVPFVGGRGGVTHLLGSSHRSSQVEVSRLMACLTDDWLVPRFYVQELFC